VCVREGRGVDVSNWDFTITCQVQIGMFVIFVRDWVLGFVWVCVCYEG